MLATDPSVSFFERELHYFRSATAFREVSLVAAMDLCAQENRCAPEWLVKEAAELLIQLLKSQKVNRRGRAGSYIAEYRRHLIDLDRWDAVVRARELRDKASLELEIAREDPKLTSNPGFKRVVEHFRKLKRWLRYGTFQCAALMVANGGGSRVTPAAIRRSYRRIEKKNATDGFRSCVFERNFLDKIGIGEQEKSGRKWRPIYDLSP